MEKCLTQRDVFKRDLFKIMCEITLNLGLTPAGFSLRAAEDLSLSGDVITVGDLSLISTAGVLSIPAAANLTATGSLVLTEGSGNLILDSIITKSTAVGSVTITAPGDITDGTGYISNTTIVPTTFDAGGLITLNNTLNNISNMSITSTGNNVTLAYPNATSLTTAGALNNVTVGANTPALTMASALNINGNLALTSGSLTMGINSLNIAGDVTSAGGNFTSTGTVTFDGAAAQAFNNTGSTLTNLVVNNSGSSNITPAAALNIDDLTLTDGTLVMAGNALNIAGDVVRTTGLLTSTGNVIFDGGGAQNLAAAGSSFQHVEISNGAGVNLTSGLMDINGNLTLTAGALTGAGNNFTIAGNVVRTAGSINSTGTVTFDGAAAQAFNNTGSTLTNIVLNNSGSSNITPAAALNIDDLTLTDGTLVMAGNALNIAGDVVRTTGLLTSTGNVIFDGGGAQNLAAAGSSFQHVEISNGAGVNLTSGLMDINGNLTLTAGALTGAGNNFTIAGNVVRTAGSINSTGTVTFDGAAAQAFNNTGSTLTNIVLNNSGSSNITPAAALNIDDLTLTNGTLVMAGNALNIAGDVTSAGGTITSTGIVTFDGVVAQAFNNTGSTFADMVINNTGPANVTPAAALDIDDLTLTNGTLVMAANALNISGQVTRTNGNLISGGVVTFDGAVTQGVDNTSSTFTDIVIANTGVPAEVTPVTALDIDNLTLTTGTLVMAGNALNIAADVLRTGGDLNSAGTVTFDGAVAQAFNASTSTLLNVTKQGLSTLTITNGPLNIDGTLTIDGAADVIDLNNVDFTIDTIFFNGSTGTFELDGSQAVQIVTTTMDQASGNVLYNGVAGGTVRLVDFYNID